MEELFQVHVYDPTTWLSKHEFIDEKLLLAQLDVFLGFTKVRGSGNVILIGPTGCGKDHLAIQSAINHSGVMFTTQCFVNMNEMDQFGYPQPIGEGLRFVYGILPAAAKHALAHPKTPVYIVEKEANFAGPGVLAVLNSFCDDARSITIPFTGEVVYRPDNVKLILTMNPWDQAGYRGTNPLSIALLDRFDQIEVEYLSVRSEVKLLQQYNDDYETCRKWAEFAAKTRRAYTKAEVTNVITTRRLIYWMQYLKVLPEKAVVRLALNKFITEEREKVLKFWGDENFTL